MTIGERRKRDAGSGPGRSKLHGHTHLVGRLLAQPGVEFAERGGIDNVEPPRA